MIRKTVKMPLQHLREAPELGEGCFTNSPEEIQFVTKKIGIFKKLRKLFGGFKHE